MISIAHGDDFLLQDPFKIKTLILNDIQKIVVTNIIMKKLIIRIHKIDPNNIKVIHLGVDIKSNIVRESVSELRKKYEIDLSDFIILTVSRFYPRKGFITILEAIKSIINVHPNLPIKYFIIGDGDEREKIENLISKMELERYVTLLGDVSDKTRNHYYQLSDLFILVPEIKKKSIEGFGIVYIEANYFDLPVIGSNSGGVKMAIEDGKSGYLIDPNDFKGLSEKILFLYHNKNIRQNLGKYGHKRVLEDFNWEKNTKKYLEILKKILKEYN
jgi:phosphatidylinositol alpha-1,6-mannosyltransferase